MFLQLAFEIILTFLCFVHTSESAQITISPKCDSMCGEFEILYLFGMNDPACYAGKWFEIECLNTSMNNVPTLTPYLKAADLEVRSIDALRSTVTVGRRRGLTMEERAFVCQLALGEPGVAHLLAPLLLHSNIDEIVCRVDLGVIGHVVRLQAGNPLLDLVDLGLVLLQEHGTPAVVEGRPHETVMTQAEQVQHQLQRRLQ
ncbi:hypothetical protein S83_065276 [Arachis hypogaea]